MMSSVSAFSRADPLSLSTPFKSGPKAIPPPLASSTPKKSKANGHSNGLVSPTGAKTKPERRNSFHRAADMEIGSPKKRKIAYMEDSEDHGVVLPVNGATNSANGSTTSPNHKKMEFAKVREMKKLADLQEQRKELPIAKGWYRNFTCLQEERY